MANTQTVTATHENGSKISITRSAKEMPRTIRLMKESGYVTFDGPLPDLMPRHDDCDCMSCRPWTY